MKRLIDKDKLLQLRNGGASCKEMAKFFGVSHNHIGKVLNRDFGLQALFPYKNRRKYSVNHSFFSNFNTENVSYFLGLLWADGSVSRETTSVVICLQEKDKYILDLFNSLIQPDKPLYFKKRVSSRHQNQFGMVMNSNIIRDKLIDYGCHPNKTLKLDWPTIDFDEENIKHFIRGFLDGDGCIGFKKNNVSNCYISFTGDVTFITKLKNKIEERLPIKCCISKINNIKATNIIKLAIYGARQCEKFCDYIYSDATVCLSRKKDKYLLIKSRTNRRVYLSIK